MLCRGSHMSSSFSLNALLLCSWPGSRSPNQLQMSHVCQLCWLYTKYSAMGAFWLGLVALQGTIMIGEKWRGGELRLRTRLWCRAAWTGSAMPKQGDSGPWLMIQIGFDPKVHLETRDMDRLIKDTRPNINKQEMFPNGQWYRRKGFRETFWTGHFCCFEWGAFPTPFGCWALSLLLGGLLVMFVLQQEHFQESLFQWVKMTKMTKKRRKWET